MNQEIDRLRKAQADAELQMAKRIADEFKRWESINEDKSKSLEIKLNKKDSDIERMEHLLIEMHKKMDSLKSDKDQADSEVKLLRS